MSRFLPVLALAAQQAFILQLASFVQCPRSELLTVRPFFVRLLAVLYQHCLKKTMDVLVGTSKVCEPHVQLAAQKKTTMLSSSGQCGLILATEISPLPFFHVRHAKILVRLRALTKHQEEGRRRNVRPFPDS